MIQSHTNHAYRRCREQPRRRKDRLGAAVVEFAFVANTLFIVIFTCVEFARINMLRNTAQDAAYYAARSAMVSGATAQDAKDVANQMLDTIGTRGYTVTVNDGAELTATTEFIKVTIAFDYHDNAFFAPLFIPNKNFTTTANMKAERYEFFYDGST